MLIKNSFILSNKLAIYVYAFMVRLVLEISNYPNPNRKYYFNFNRDNDIPAVHTSFVINSENKQALASSGERATTSVNVISYQASLRIELQVLLQ